MLRRALDAGGFGTTTIVAADGGADICTKLAADPEYDKAVGIIGLHYPSDYYDLSACHALGKPVWASEESSSYDDLYGNFDVCFGDQNSQRGEFQLGGVGNKA